MYPGVNCILCLVWSRYSSLDQIRRWNCLYCILQQLVEISSMSVFHLFSYLLENQFPNQCQLNLYHGNQCYHRSSAHSVQELLKNLLIYFRKCSTKNHRKFPQTSSSSFILNMQQLEHDASFDPILIQTWYISHHIQIHFL